VGDTHSVLHKFYDCSREAIQNILTLLRGPIPPRVIFQSCLASDTLIARFVPSAGYKFRHMEVLEASVKSDLVPLTLEI
jgi:hypothetical protein